MHHFQLKPVRSLDSLRPAWSGHLRHGPPPSTVITNPRKVSSTKQILFSSSSYPLPPSSSLNQSKPFTSNSATAKPNSTVENETSPPTVSHNQTQPNQFLIRELHNDFMKPIVNLSSCTREKGNAKSEERSSNDQKFNPRDILTRADPIQSTWDGEPFDRPFKTSNFLHEVNEDDPFDTSRVFTPTYLQQAAPLFQSAIPSTPAQSHPLSHPFDTTSRSAQAKVNIIVHYLFISVKTFRSIFSWLGP